MSDSPAHWLEAEAKRIPESIRKIILEYKHIDNAVNTHEPGMDTPMEYIFDVYEEFIDVSGQYDDFSCGPCRQHVLDNMKKLKPYLEKLENGNGRTNQQ